MCEYRAKSAFFSVDPGIDIHYWDQGPVDGGQATDTPGDSHTPACIGTLVFIPGLTFSGEIFKAQSEYFSSRGWRVISVDPRGQGLSTKTCHGNDYVTHGSDLIKLMGGLGIKKPVLVGWSTGNLEVWSYLEQAGYEAVSGAVTIDMSPLPLSSDPAWWTEGTPDELSQVASRILITPEGANDFWYEYLTEVMMQRKLSDAECEYILDMSRRTPYWICHELFCNAIFSNYLEVAQTAAQKIPTLMYIAEHWADVAEPFCHEYLPETPTYVMGGHLMAYEYPDRFNARLEEFLVGLV